MIRVLNFLALVAMIASATWAYSVKYETILVAETLKKRNAELRHEHDAIAVLEAEWQLLNRPARLAVLAKPGEGMMQMSARQVALPRGIPAPLAKVDALDTLVTGSLFAAPSTPEPSPPNPAGARAGAGKASHPPSAKAKQNAPLQLQPNAGAARAAAPGAADKAVEARLKGSAPMALTRAPTARAGGGGPAGPIPPAPIPHTQKSAPVKNTGMRHSPSQNPVPKAAIPGKATPKGAAPPESAVLGALVKKVLN